ncbi:MAG: right-handed parallel beta-helix repeat-containing protein, partial [Fibrobacter sp.]|nr:right-handed parallel beta-helix repeat-containing protein [Fibrobacter sp.]
MKYAYKTLLSTIALGSAVIFAQAPAAPEATAQATPAVQAAAPATAEQAAAPAAAAPVPAETAPAAEASSATNAPAAPAVNAPATNATAAPAAETAPAEQAAVPAAEQAPAATAEQTAATVPADTAQKAPDSTVAAVAPADSATGGFVADTTTPPPTLLEGTEIAGDIHGFLKLDKSPYLATDMLIVSPNMSLVVEPGVIIYFKPGTGLQVNKGQLVIAGSAVSPVTFRSAYDRPKAGDWLGVTITGDQRAEIRNVQISDAAVGIAVENGSMDIKDAKIENTSVRGVYARNASIAVSDVEFRNNPVALQVANYANAIIDRATFEKNKVAIMNSELAEAHVSSSKIEDNEVGLLNMANSLITFNNTEITKNGQGVSSAEVLAPEIIERVKGNTLDLDNQAEATVSTLPPAPEIPGIEQRPLRASDKIGDIVAQRLEAETRSDSTVARWCVVGNVMFGT